VTANPSALDFGSVPTGTTSGARTVTVSNPTGAAAAVSSIAATGDFAQTNTCGSSIPAAGSCTVSVTFKPTATGARSGSLTVNAGGVTNTVTLTGTGTAPGPVLGADPGGLSFGGTVVGTTTAAKTVTLTNTGTTSATISGVTVSGDFAQTNSCATLAVGASCTVNVTFKPTTGGTRSGTLTVTSNANNSPTTVGLSGSGIDSSTNIAAGKTASASSANLYPASNITDTDASTYWEATGGFPSWAQVDLGQSYSVGKVTLKLPPATAWAARTQTLAVQGSTDGQSFTNLAGPAGYTFDPATGNTVTISFNAATARYVRVNITANTGWSQAQLSDLEVFPAGGGTSPSSATLSANPTSLAFADQAPGSTSAAKTVTLSNTGNAAATISSIAVTGDFSQTNTCGSTIAAGASCTVSVKFAPQASGAHTGTLTVAGNASNSPTLVALSGTGTGTVSTNLAAGKPTTESSHTDVYPSSNVTDGNQATYWESANNAFPQWVQVDLGSAQSVGRLVLQLPGGWDARTETLSVQGSTDGSSFTTVKSAAGYTFDPNGQNTVTVTFSATTQRYIRLNFTANTGWPAGQLSELQVWSS
jgi:hypothetical protein